MWQDNNIRYSWMHLPISIIWSCALVLISTSSASPSSFLSSQHTVTLEHLPFTSMTGSTWESRHGISLLLLCSSLSRHHLNLFRLPCSSLFDCTCFTSVLCSVVAASSFSFCSFVISARPSETINYRFFPLLQPFDLKSLVTYCQLIFRNDLPVLTSSCTSPLTTLLCLFRRFVDWKNSKNTWPCVFQSSGLSKSVKAARLLYNSMSCLNIISYKTLANTIKISVIYPINWQDTKWSPEPIFACNSPKTKSITEPIKSSRDTQSLYFSSLITSSFEWLLSTIYSCQSNR